jgi:type IV pilus assembly protein PilC
MKKLNSVEQLTVSKQFSTLLQAGLPLLDVVSLLEMSFVTNSLKQGRTLSASFQHLGFDMFCISLLQTGEMSGSLAKSFLQIEIYLNKKIEINRKVRRALHYPTIVVLTSSFILWAMMMWVIPSFEQMFSNFQAELPLPTLILISASHWLKNYWMMIGLAIIVSLLIGFQIWQKCLPIQQKTDFLLSRLPIIGPIRKASLLAQWSKNISTLLASGMPILDAMRQSALISNDWLTFKLCSDLNGLLSQGWSLTDSLSRLKAQRYFLSESQLQLIKVGESSGELCSMLELISTQASDQLDELVDGLTQSLEPLLMVIMGLIIGTLVISLYLPIFQMGQIL